MSEHTTTASDICRKEGCRDQNHGEVDDVWDARPVEGASKAAYEAAASRLGGIDAAHSHTATACSERHPCYGCCIQARAALEAAAAVARTRSPTASPASVTCHPETATRRTTVAETTIIDHLRDEENFGGMELRLTAADEIERLRSVLYDAICGSSDDPADYGVTLDHQNGVALLGNQEEYDRG